MIDKFKMFGQILKNQGARYVAYRASHELGKLTGLLKRRFPTDPPTRQFISLANWRVRTMPFFFASRNDVILPKNTSEVLKTERDQVLQGRIRMFNSSYINLGLDYDWLTHPLSEHRYSTGHHWTEISDFSRENGDIKYVWEKSRFSYLYTLIRYDHHFEEDSSEFVLQEIEDWIDANPINRGPNFRCSQEISLRLFNWTFALYFYRDSKALSELRFQKIMYAVYWQLRHVRENISFSRIAVRNNHAITECLALYLLGLLYPFFPESEAWVRQGKEWFEEEIAYQIYEDGTYLQHSHNYQRVVVQLLSWAILLNKKLDQPFTAKTYQRAEKVLTYLGSVMASDDHGELPNYGSNDGALFFPLSTAKYRDFRPQLNALAFALHGNLIFSDLTLMEEAQWYGASNVVKIEKQSNLPMTERSFDDGGIYTIRDGATFTFFKCQEYRDRPAQADNLHVDIWINGENILRDAGTFLYNTDPELLKFFGGTCGHNSVTLGDQDQMAKGPRFIWFDWSRRLLADVRKSENEVVLTGKISGFKHLGSQITHQRTVHKPLGEATWVVIDTLTHATGLPIRQWWHPHPAWSDKMTFRATDDKGQQLLKKEALGWYSTEYGKKEESPCFFFETYGSSISTNIEVAA